MKFYQKEFNFENIKEFFSTIEEKSQLFRVNDDVSVALVIDNVVDGKTFYVVHDVFINDDKANHLAYRCDLAPFPFTSEHFYNKLKDWVEGSGFLYKAFMSIRSPFAFSNLRAHFEGGAM